MRVRLVLAIFMLALVVPTAASARTVSHVRTAIGSTAAFPDIDRSAKRHGYVILNAWQQDRLRALKRANPWLKVLVYKNLAFASKSTAWTGEVASGVRYGEADRDHPDWFLLNTSGQRFSSWSYEWNVAMDVGNRGYQDRWADNVISELRSEGWDGVFMDDVNTTFKYHYEVKRIAKYPDDASYSAATRSALASIAPRVRASGKLVVANIGSWSENYSTGIDWLRYLDGAMDEMFVKWGEHPGKGYSPWSWHTQVNELRETERQGKDFLGITHSATDDARAARYGYATMLLASNGRSSFALAQDYSAETWFPEYDYDLGAPLGPAKRDSDGVYRRSFQRGLVLVNPTDSAKRVSFGGGYHGSGLARAGGAELKPTSGLILKGHRGRGGSGPATPTVLAIVKGRGRVALSWTRGPSGIKRYRVLRNGRVVKVTRGRRFLDRRTRPRRRYRYRVVALGRNGRVLGRSKRARMSTPRRRGLRARASAVVVRRVRGTLAAPRRRGRVAFAQRRVRIRGRVVWRRVTRVTRPRPSMRLAIRAPSFAVVRVVVRLPGGERLRSAPFRVGSG
jgi:Hypothetical glycosyl hydrolase family 15